MARKKHAEEHENHERWLVSYADFITLLFAFFVVMYAVSSVNEGKYRVLSNSMTTAFGSPTSGRSMIPVTGGQSATSGAHTPVEGLPQLIALPIPVVPEFTSNNDASAKGELEDQFRKETPPERDVDMLGKGEGKSESERDMEQIADQITAAMGGLIRDELIDVRREDRWIEVEINSSILFPSGSARLAPAAFPVLEQLAEILAGFPNSVHVEGFTDNVPIYTAAFRSNWELSAARASSVVHLFTDYGVKPERMAAIGYGEFKPIASNDSVEGRAKNRRVVLIVLAGSDPRWTREAGQISSIVKESPQPEVGQ